MNWHNIRFGFRLLLRKKTFSIINITGLAVSIACSLVILGYVKHETSYDKFHEKASRIFRVVFDIKTTGERTYTAVSPFAPGPALVEDFPEIEQSVRIDLGRKRLLSRDDKQYMVETICYADSNFFDLFDYPIYKGDPGKALSSKENILISKDIADSLFKNEDPIGKKLLLNTEEELTVSGILDDVKKPSHLNFNVLVPLFAQPKPDSMNAWFSLTYYTYILLSEDANSESINSELNDFLDARAGLKMDMVGMWLQAKLQPIESIHLHSNLWGEIEKKGDARLVQGLSAIVIVLLIVAGINYVNLSTARFADRAREVGIRKVFGAEKKHLVLQSLTETLMISVIAILISASLVELTIPIFKRLIGVDFDINIVESLPLHFTFGGFGLLVMTLMGVMPSIVFARVRPSDMIKGHIRNRPSAKNIRQILVVFQYTIGISLLFCTMVTLRQYNFLQNYDLGFEQSGLITVPVLSPEVRPFMQNLKEDISKIPTVSSATATSSLPGMPLAVRLILPEDVSDDEVREAGLLFADHDYVETMGLELVDGRYFDRDVPSDTTAWVISEEMQKELGWTNPIGKIIDFPPRGRAPGQVIGVFKDYHHLSLQTKTPPMVIHLWKSGYIFITARTEVENFSKTLDSIGKIWSEYSENWPFDHISLEDLISSNYKQQRKLTMLFAGFTFLTLFIACLGIYGLATYNADRRTKEIGVRKVLGASWGALCKMLMIDYLKIVLIAGITAYPIARYVLNQWLKSFPYHIDPDVWSYVLSVILALGFAIVTISRSSIRAAKSSPAKMLRYE